MPLGNLNELVHFTAKSPRIVEVAKLKDSILTRGNIGYARIDLNFLSLPINDLIQILQRFGIARYEAAVVNLAI